MGENRLQNSEGANLNSSLSEFFNKEVSQEEYIERITKKLQPILNRRFVSEPEKREIRIKSGRINFNCPFCGDSTEDPGYKVRGNIILKGKYANYFKCHNCGVFLRVDNLFKQFNEDLDLDVINYITNHVGDFSTEGSSNLDAGLLLDIQEIDKFSITRDFFRKIFGLEEVENSRIYPWLKKRLQFKKEHFLFHPTRNYLYILNLTPNGKILGVQKRNFGKSAKKAKYETYKLSKLYEFIKERLQKLNKNTSKFDLSKFSNEKIEEIDTFSQIFNITRINIAKKITVFEGWMDALLFKNSVGNSGLQKAFPIDIPRRYWFDDDDEGRKKTIQLIQEGYEVFLWKKFKYEMSLPYKKKWDLNDVFIYLKHNNIKTPFFENYFSSDFLDAIDI